MTPVKTQAAVVITCFTEKRWPQLVASIDSACAQTLTPQDVIVVVDHNDQLLARVARRWPGITVLANRFAQGASGTRNTGALHARSPVLAFLDDDATAEPKWLELLVRCFDDPTVVGVGGGVVAAWSGVRPRWFPDEFSWVVGASYRGQPEETAEVRNVWAENMAVRTDRFVEVGGFRVGFGKVGARSSPEDTDLCIQMGADGGRWLYVPAARVAHHVPAERSTLGFFLRRCYSEGSGKAALADLTSTGSLGNERDYVRAVVPRAIGRDLRAAVRARRLAPAWRAAAMAAGVAMAGAGYARGRLATLPARASAVSNKE